MNAVPPAGPPTPDLALVTHDLRKAYRLYAKSMHKFLDVFGLCPRGAYSEHLAVDGINLEIARGEKVALIGRNGAGKSTLLKLITETIRPTSGSVDVNGRVSALLQIGTGFHPDFTGRQNVYSGFAHMGVTGPEADELFDKVVDFAEIENFIDQPMKTYSTGMAARLMFSAATALVPEILIIDEVLGVGDAYFSHKSYEHMRKMCAQHDTTLLLVTHDLYSALNICDRFIWIDKGRIRRDGDARSTLDAYENSIKEQEEERLRSRNQKALLARDAGYTGVRLRVSSRNGFALASPLALERIVLGNRDGNPITLEVAQGHESWSLLPEGNLGPATTVEGRSCRTLAAHGSIYHQAEWSVQLPKAEALEAIQVSYRYEGPDGVDLSLHTLDGLRLVRAALEPTEGWTERTIPIAAEAEVRSAVSSESPEADGVAAQYGTGLVRVHDVSFVDAEGQSVVQIAHGSRLGIEVECTMDDPAAVEEVTFLVGFHRSGVAIGSYLHRDRLVLPGTGRFVVRALLDPVLLGSGEWLVTVGIGEPDVYHAEFNPYFTVNDRWYHFIPRGQTLQVTASASIDPYAVFLHPSEVEVVARKSEEMPAGRATVD